MDTDLDRKALQSSIGTAVGARVRAARTHRRLSLRELARHLDMSPSTLSQVENGKTRLTVVRMTEIAEFLNTTIQDILAPSISKEQYAVAVEKLPTRSSGSENSPKSQTDPATAASPRVQDWRTYPPLYFDFVLESALNAFLEAGYHGATVRDIARRCGLSVSGIYHHYPSKQEMLRKILDLTMTELLARARIAREQGHDPVERLSLLVENLALYHTHRRQLAFVGASEMRSLDPDNYRQIADMRQIQHHLVEREVEGAVALGEFRAQRPREASRAIVTMCTALAQWFRPNGLLTPEEIAEHYVEYAFNLLAYGST